MKTHSVRRIATAGALLVLATLASLTGARFGAQPARANPSMIDMAMSIDVNGGGDDCDTRPSPPGPLGIGTTCTVTVGGMFTVKGLVDEFAGVAGGAYGGIHFLFNNSAGLTLMQRSTVTELGPAGTPYWPSCFSRTESKPAGGYEPVCHSSGPTSIYKGKVVEVDYTCASAGSRTITMVDSTTFLYDSSHTMDNSDKEGDEILTINCVSAVGGIAHLPNVAGTAPLAAEDSSSSWSAWLFALAAAAAATIVIAGAAWRLRSRRAR